MPKDDTMTAQALATQLMGTALCNTDHPGDAATALIVAAGEILHAKFGIAGALSLMRGVLDDTEAAMIAKHGRQPGEVVN